MKFEVIDFTCDVEFVGVNIKEKWVDYITVKWNPSWIDRLMGWMDREQVGQYTYRYNRKHGTWHIHSAPKVGMSFIPPVAFFNEITPKLINK